MALEQNTFRDAVLTALAAAEVPGELAFGILQILVNAGYDKLQAPFPQKAPLLSALGIEALMPALLDQAHTIANGSQHLRRQAFWDMNRLAVRHHLHGVNVEAAGE